MIEINMYVINYVVSSLRDDHKHSILTRNVKLEMMERLLQCFIVQRII